MPNTFPHVPSSRNGTESVRLFCKTPPPCSRCEDEESTVVNIANLHLTLFSIGQSIGWIVIFIYIRPQWGWSWWWWCGLWWQRWRLNEDELELYCYYVEICWKRKVHFHGHTNTNTRNQLKIPCRFTFTIYNLVVEFQLVHTTLFWVFLVFPECWKVCGHLSFIYLHLQSDKES